jgi:hypothetical protein
LFRSRASTRKTTKRRRSPRRWRYVALLLLTLAGCGRGREHALLTQFFAASRLRDLTALQKISTVVFEPARDGVVTGFDIESVTAKGDGAKAVVIAAPVRLPDGRTEKKRFVLTVQGGLITAISESRAAASTPPR